MQANARRQAATMHVKTSLLILDAFAILRAKAPHLFHAREHRFEQLTGGHLPAAERVATEVPASKRGSAASQPSGS